MVVYEISDLETYKKQVEDPNNILYLTYFYEDNHEESKKMRAVVDDLHEQYTGRLNVILVNMNSVRNGSMAPIHKTYESYPAPSMGLMRKDRKRGSAPCNDESNMRLVVAGNLGTT